MNLPDQPSTFRPPSPADRPWWWRLESESGDEAPVSDEYAGKRFTSQADAESWVGEIWSELADQGVAQVSLFEHDRAVYGPMSLQP